MFPKLTSMVIFFIGFYVKYFLCNALFKPYFIPGRDFVDLPSMVKYHLSPLLPNFLGTAVVVFFWTGDPITATRMAGIDVSIILILECLNSITIMVFSLAPLNEITYLENSIRIKSDNNQTKKRGITAFRKDSIYRILQEFLALVQILTPIFIFWHIAFKE